MTNDLDFNGLDDTTINAGGDGDGFPRIQWVYGVIEWNTNGARDMYVANIHDVVRVELRSGSPDQYPEPNTWIIVIDVRSRRAYHMFVHRDVQEVQREALRLVRELLAAAMMEAKFYDL